MDKEKNKRLQNINEQFKKVVNKKLLILVEQISKFLLMFSLKNFKLQNM